MLTQNDFNALINAHPELTATGYGIDRSYKPGTQEYQERWDSERALLFQSYKQYLYCLDWLSKNKKSVLKRDLFRKKPNTKALKGRVEQWLKTEGIEDHYIPQGAFIVAALSMGYEIDRVDQGGPHVILR